jgi:ABC-type branched-subunit amino acid transport system substrate-binding protein
MPVELSEAAPTINTTHLNAIDAATVVYAARHDDPEANAIAQRLREARRVLAVRVEGYRYASHSISNAAKIYERRGLVNVKIEHPNFDGDVDAAHDWARANLDLVPL